MRRYIVDCDPGVDDALALLLAFASGELKVEAITIVAGNVAAEAGARNALLTIDAAHIDSPPLVAIGEKKPLEREVVRAEHVHGEDGLGGAANELGKPSGSAIGAPAVDVLLETISYSPREISVLALGPLTNLARAFLSDPGTMALVREIIIMGGALRAPGNASATAEFNFFADPEAARIVLGSGAPITLVGLDVTTRAMVERAEVERLARTSSKPAAAFARRVCRGYFEMREARTGRTDLTLHDPLAVAAAIDPTFIRTENHLLDVETDGGLTAGMLMSEPRANAPQRESAQSIAVAVEVDSDRFRAFFLDRVFG